jgi:glycosyltransferase involved in cell wall biosynthesis
MLHRGDAVGRHTLHLRDLMAARGISSRIYVEMMDPETASECLPFTDYPAESQPGDVLVYQFATASQLAPWLLARTEVLVVNYHNVTPPEHYAPWDNGLARHQLKARDQLASLAPRTSLGIAVSTFNEAELRAAGYARTAVVPPAAMLTTGGLAVQTRPPSRHRGARWITVGRLAPNKAIQHAVMALLVARAHEDPEASLEIVGRPVVPSYTKALHRFVDEMGLHEVVTFRGQISDQSLEEAMAMADVLVVTSVHEGFGVPTVEAMSSGLPVVANDAGALKDVVGRGGVLIDTSDPWALAHAVTEVLASPDPEARTAAALHQVESLGLWSAGDRLVDLVNELR